MSRAEAAKGWGVFGLLLSTVLFVPDPMPAVPSLPEGELFEWRADQRFASLEASFLQAKEHGCPGDAEGRISSVRSLAADLRNALPTDEGWRLLEQGFFQLVADLGGCPERLSALLGLRSDLRALTKDASRAWPDEPAARQTLYRILYGTRTAVEELLLQSPPEQSQELSQGQPQPSAAPSAEVKGVLIHSGDLLVSRGGAPTSAFIARGSNYPGSFSHVALAHVSEQGTVSLIESHIESGVGVFAPDDYFKDKKLRVMVLRLSAGLPALQQNPRLPHEIATHALEQARAVHIPYDFAMDIVDSSAQFCSEVASSNYRSFGLSLWAFESRFSSPGLARWMSALGVRNLRTHGPSDLEYDPQLRVVAEWHAADTLFDDHVDNVVIDAMLEQAEQGARLGHSLWMLPMARAAKAYSWAVNRFGGVGPVPEGMSATVALRAEWLGARHAAIKVEVLRLSRSFERHNGYRPPYWRLFQFAEAVTARMAWAG